eukprot:m.251825 g.251825  ORF g.251825 m.251825 type:complete len:414 (+) comp19546_c0_seq1:200-1441(+)
MASKLDYSNRSSVEKYVIDQSGWPEEVFKDESKKPKVVHSKEDFLEELFFGNHMNDVVVFPNGIKEFGMESAVPQYLTECLRSSSTVREFLSKIPADKRERLKGRVYHKKDKARRWIVGSEKELKKSQDGETLYSLEEKWTELQKHPEVPDKHMYIAEMRKLDKYKHPLTGEWVKTVVDTDMKDTVPPYWDFMMPYWDRFDEGVFVGGPLSGSPLHVDQVQWSNIGKNWDGCKLMALWKYGTDSHAFLDKHLRKLFVNTDDEEEMSQLRHACKIVIAQPGDLFIFSGANPHAVMCMGDSLSMTGYESFVNLNPVHAQVFVDTNRKPHFEECWADDEDVADIKEDAIDALHKGIDLIIHEQREQLVHPKFSKALDVCIETLCSQDTKFATELRDLRSKRRKIQAKNQIKTQMVV